MVEIPVLKNIRNIVARFPVELITFNTFLILILSFGATKLDLEYSQKSWFRSNDPLVEKFEVFKKEYNTGSNLILLLELDEPLNAASIKQLKQLNEDLVEAPFFTRVEDLTNFTTTLSQDDEILIEPLIPEDFESADIAKIQSDLVANNDIKDFLISDDLKNLAVYAYLKTPKGKEGLVSNQATLFVKDQIRDKYPLLNIQITGPGSLGYNFQRETTKDMTLILPIAFFVMTLLLFLVLKNFFTVALSLGLIVITVLSTLGVQGWLGVKVGLITSMCSLIVMGICIMDLVHILTSYLKNKGDILLSLEENLKPTLLTTITTIIGFMSFVTAKLLPIADLGIIASIGIALAWYFSVFLVGPLLYLIPISTKYSEKKLSFRPLANFIVKRPISIGIAFTFLTVLGFKLALNNKIDSNMQNYFGAKTEFKQVIGKFKEKIGATESVDLLVESDTDIKDPVFLKKVDSLIEKIEARSDVTKVISLLPKIKETNRVFMNTQEDSIPLTSEQTAQILFFLELGQPAETSIRNYHSRDEKQLRLIVRWHNSSSEQLKKASAEIVALVQATDLNGHITGLAPLILGLDSYVIFSFVESMLLATVLIFIFMSLVFKNLFIGTLSIIPNIIVPLFGGAALYLAGRSFDMGSVLIFSICLGIAIDDTIFFITHYQGQNKNLDVAEKIQRTLDTCASTLCKTTLILVSMFGLFYLGSFTPNKNFAIATVTVLSSALLLDLVLLPVLLIFANKIGIKFKAKKKALNN